MNEQVAWVLSLVVGGVAAWDILGRTFGFGYAKGNSLLLSVDDDLRRPSPLTPKQIDEYLAWKAPALSGLGKSFKKAERDTGVNAEALVGIAVHESGNGTSRIAQDKKNLFGWNAVDASPYESAFAFNSYDECISFVAGRIRDLYFISMGRTTLRKMGEVYASDGAWAEIVLKRVKEIHTKLGYNRG